MKITICGGGNIGHVCAGFLGAEAGVEVRLLSHHPEKWRDHVLVRDGEGRTFQGRLTAVSASAGEVVPGADIVLLCLPGPAIRPTLQQICPYLTPQMAVGSVVCNTGFFFAAHDVLPSAIPLFGFQRVPFIARTIEYGASAELKGYKSHLYMAAEHVADEARLCRCMESLFRTPTSLLESHYEASLSNSNPLLHPARLYTLWGDWHSGIVYEKVPQFYSDWTTEAAQLYIDMDGELQQLLRHLGVRQGAIPDVLTYYESYDAPSLARKIRSIEAFQNIPAPMLLQDGGGYVPDFGHRYFTEDFPYGLRFICNLAEQEQTPATTLKRVCEWGLSMGNTGTGGRNYLAKEAEL